MGKQTGTGRQVAAAAQASKGPSSAFARGMLLLLLLRVQHLEIGARQVSGVALIEVENRFSCNLKQN